MEPSLETDQLQTTASTQADIPLQSQDISSTTKTDPFFLSERTHKMKDRFGIWQTVWNWNLIGPISATCSTLNKHSRKQWRNGLSSYSVMNKAEGT
jgi:hypothetical protein